MATATTTPGPKVNRIGLPVVEYRGGKSTLCAGCGHNAISERIIDAMFEMGVQPERLMKLSGIGCSSKSPAYFMTRSGCTPISYMASIMRSEMALWPQPAQSVVLPPRYSSTGRPIRLTLGPGVAVAVAMD